MNQILPWDQEGLCHFIHWRWIFTFELAVRIIESYHFSLVTWTLEVMMILFSIASHSLKSMFVTWWNNSISRVTFEHIFIYICITFIKKSLSGRNKGFFFEQNKAFFGEEGEGKKCANIFRTKDMIFCDKKKIALKRIIFFFGQNIISWLNF